MRYSGAISSRRVLAYLSTTSRARLEAKHIRMSGRHRPLPGVDELAIFGNLPLRARLADRLADAMFAVDEAVMMCELESVAIRDASWMEPRLRSTFDELNALMKLIVD